jgi:hypothetical protein
MEQTQHTPTPWKVSKLSFESGRFPENHNSSSYFIIDGENKKANAEFIVKACNAYDEMLAFIEEVATVSLADHVALVALKREALELIEKVRS